MILEYHVPFLGNAKVTVIINRPKPHYHSEAWNEEDRLLLVKKNAAQGMMMALISNRFAVS